jgi:microcystin degradation protein MlrC
MKPRILTAGLFHETHTFLDELTRWEDFAVVCDERVLARRGDGSPTDGFLTTADELGFEVIPTIDARATPSGMVADVAFERYWTEFERRARPALAAGVDGIFLVLHGAMVTESHPDLEGEFLTRLRALPGAQDVPLFGVLDLHANVTARMCRLANGLVMYRENPHTDARAAAVRGTQLLGRALRERVVPRMVWCRPPLMWAPPGTGTGADPMLALERWARQVEQERPEIWECNVAAGFSFADTPVTGFSLCAITVGAEVGTQAVLESGARLAWSIREAGNIVYPAVEVVVAQLAAKPSPAGPVLLVEHSDNIGGGAPGDGTGVLRSLLAHGIAKSLVVINDPETVAALSSVAIGAACDVTVGGRSWRGDAGPVAITATLVSRRDGRFELEDANSHLASMSGTRFDMGPCAVIRSGGVTVLLTSRKTPPFDLGQLRSQGLEPCNFAVIGVKAAVAHKRAYDPITGASYYVDTPGPCSSNLSTFPWRQLHRPVWPLDAGTNFSCEFS